jgi:PhnB protein
MPRLRVRNAPAAIDFYKKAFGAQEVLRFDVQGTIAHAHLTIGNAAVLVAEESPDLNLPGPATLGGSPVGMMIDVENADTAVARALDAGATLVMPVADQFYGDRTGQVADPFGYTWALNQRVEELPVEEMYRRFEALKQSAPKPRKFARPGFRTVTPYIVAKDAIGLVAFMKTLLGAEEKFRAIGKMGGLHCELKVGDSMMMVGGGGEGLKWSGDAGPMPFHVYVPDVDSTYRAALDAGCESLDAPADHEWGERSANVKDPFGNFWYLATFKGETYYRPGFPTVQPYLQPLRAEPMVQFLRRAFGAKEMGRFANPEGVVLHSTITVGDSTLELCEAMGPYQPMPGMFYLYVPDADAAYQKALSAGASSVQTPVTQSYGDRTAAVKDIFGNQWYLATSMETAT